MIFVYSKEKNKPGFRFQRKFKGKILNNMMSYLVSDFLYFEKNKRNKFWINKNIRLFLFMG